MTPVDVVEGRYRSDDHNTSIAGAESVAFRAGSQKAKLLAAFADAGPRGMTDDEAAIATGLDRSCFWKRCGELRAAGLLVDTGMSRPGPLFGEQRMVSAITRLGRDLVAQMEDD